MTWLLDARSHDEDNGHITGTIEVTAAFAITAIRAAFCSKSIAVQSRCKVTPPDNLVRGCALTGRTVGAI
jgi:hypothetical protein